MADDADKIIGQYYPNTSAGMRPEDKMSLLERYAPRFLRNWLPQQAQDVATEFMKYPAAPGYRGPTMAGRAAGFSMDDIVRAQKIDANAEALARHDLYSPKGHGVNYDPGVTGGPESFNNIENLGKVATGLTPRPIRGQIDPPPSATPPEAIALRNLIEEMHQETPRVLARAWETSPPNRDLASNHLREIDRLRDLYNQQYGSLDAPVVKPYEAALARQQQMREFGTGAANDAIPTEFRGAMRPENLNRPLHAMEPNNDPRGYRPDQVEVGHGVDRHFLTNGDQHWKAQLPHSEGNVKEGAYVTGYAVPSKGEFRVSESNLPLELQGLGHGLPMYRALFDKAFREGLAAGSDTVVSPKAQRVYAALARRGYKVERNPSAHQESDGTLRMRGASQPVFSVGAPDVEPPPYGDGGFVDSLPALPAVPPKRTPRQPPPGDPPVSFKVSPEVAPLSSRPMFNGPATNLDGSPATRAGLSFTWKF